jgi:hypothetical protein
MGPKTVPAKRSSPQSGRKRTYDLAVSHPAPDLRIGRSREPMRLATARNGPEEGENTCT